MNLCVKHSWSKIQYILQTYQLSEGIDDDGGPSGQLMKYIFVNVVMVQPITIEYKYHIEQMWVRPTLYTN